MFLVRELNPGLTHLLASFFLAASFLAMELAGGPARRRWARHAQLAGHAVGLLIAVYVACLVAFYALPLAAALIKAVTSFSWWQDFGRAVVRSEGAVVMVLVVAVPFLALLVALFVGTPLALPVLYAQSFARVFRAHRPTLGRQALVPCAAAVVGSLALFVIVNRQPQVAAFEALAEPPADDAARVRLLRDKEQLRAGLVNAYVASYRYLGADGEAGDLARLYRDEVGLPDGAARRVQLAFASLARPVFYDGASMTDDARRAEALYRSFFDAPIQKSENQAVLRALTATYSRTDREAGLLDRGQRRVLLAKQEVTVHAAWPRRRDRDS
jgi:putative PEP-CTERM system integral membrane protein